MQYLANILTLESFKTKRFYNVISNKDGIIPNIPTLIIGWNLTKELYPNASILNWKIDDNTYWTHGKRVKREQYEKNIVAFENLVLDRVDTDIEYSFFNVLISSREEKIEFFKLLRDTNQKYILISDEMMYIYVPVLKKTFGVLLSDIDYEGGDRKLFISTCILNPNNTLVKERDHIAYDLQKLVKNRKYIVPYLASVGW